MVGMLVKRYLYIIKMFECYVILFCSPRVAKSLGWTMATKKQQFKGFSPGAL